LSYLGLFRFGRASSESRPVEGLSFFIRPAARNPTDPPFPFVRRDERLEATESLYLLTVLLSTADVSPTVSDIPGGPVRYIPYYDVPEPITAPKRTNAASLAMAARYFRRDTRTPSRLRVFDFDPAPERWVYTHTAQGASTMTDEDWYRTIAKLTGKQGSLHGAVCYFVLKLDTIMKAGKLVSACSTRLIALQ
jgi:hypothetical protein